MASRVFELYRLKFIRHDFPLFEHMNESPTSSLYRHALNAAPELKTGRVTTWRIGGINELPDIDGMSFFQFGKTIKSRQAVFDETTRTFTETEGEDSPYTHVVLDWSIGVVAIEQHTKLASNTRSIAKMFAAMLTATAIVSDNDIRVQIDPIPDPEGFIRILKTCHEIISFRATFSGPNPTDADAWFSKPLANISAKTGGKGGSVQIKSGGNGGLRNDKVIEAVQSVAKTGNQASARVKRNSNSTPTTEKLGKTSASTIVSENASNVEIGIALREKYNEVGRSG